MIKPITHTGTWGEHPQKPPTPTSKKKPTKPFGEYLREAIAKRGSQ